MSPRILLLDDDLALLLELEDFLAANGFQVDTAPNVEAAVTALAVQPDFTIVDLFLSGNDGAELSNDFIRDHLLPRQLRYGRLTSAPRLVPAQFAGEWILDKRQVIRAPELLLEKLLPLFRCEKI